MINCIVFRKNVHSWHKFYTTAGRDGRDKSQLCTCCALAQNKKWEQVCFSFQVNSWVRCRTKLLSVQQCKTKRKTLHESSVPKSAKVNCSVLNSAKVSSVAIQFNRSVQTLRILCRMLQSAEHYNCESYNAKLCKTLQHCCAQKAALSFNLSSLFAWNHLNRGNRFYIIANFLNFLIIAIAMLTIFILTENTDLFIEMKILLVIFCNYFFI